MPDWKPEIRRRLANLRLEPTREAAIVEELAQHSVEALRALEHRHVPGALEDHAPRARDQLLHLLRVADRHEASPRQVALAFLARHAQVFPNPKASTVAHVEENAGAGTIVLSAESVDELETAFPAAPWTGDLPMI